MLTAGARTRQGTWVPGFGTRSLAALAGEDRAALSGRPRKANAGQYEIVLQHRNLVHKRDATAHSNEVRPPNPAFNVQAISARRLC